MSHPSTVMEPEINVRVLADYLHNNGASWVKAKIALYSNAGTSFRSIRFPARKVRVRYSIAIEGGIGGRSRKQLLHVQLKMFC